MKQLISLVLVIGSLFSCVKDKDYPTVFQYDYNGKTTLNSNNYTALLSDTALHITGIHAEGIIDIHIPRSAGNPVVIGEYTTAIDNGFYISHTSVTGTALPVMAATLNLTHINSYVNFTFEADLINGLLIENGIANNLPFTTINNNTDTLVIMPF